MRARACTFVCACAVEFTRWCVRDGVFQQNVHMNEVKCNLFSFCFHTNRLRDSKVTVLAKIRSSLSICKVNIRPRSVTPM